MSDSVENKQEIVGEPVAKDQAEGIAPDVVQEGIASLSLDKKAKGPMKIPEKRATEPIDAYVPAKEINIFEEYDSPPDLVIRSPISPKTKSGFPRSMSASSLDSAAISDGSGTPEIDIHDPDYVRRRLSRYSKGCYNPITEANTIVPDPNDTREWHETRIPIRMVSVEQEVPLVDRPGEMAELLEFNKDITKTLKYRLGEEKWAEAEELWCKTTRGQMKDKKWLARTYRLLVKGIPGDQRPWTEWRLMVGWDPINLDRWYNQFEEDEAEEATEAEARPSSSGVPLKSIQEGDD